VNLSLALSSRSEAKHGKTRSWFSFCLPSHVGGIEESVGDQSLTFKDSWQRIRGLRFDSRGRLNISELNHGLLKHGLQGALELPHHFSLDALARDDELGQASARPGDSVDELWRCVGADAEGEDTCVLGVLADILDDLAGVGHLAVGLDDR